MPERVRDLAETVSPEHVRRGHLGRGARRNGAIIGGIDVLDVEVEGNRCWGPRLGSDTSHNRSLFGQENKGITDSELGMHDFAGGTGHAHRYLGSKCFLVKIQGTISALHDQVRGNSVHSFRDWLDCLGHVFLLLSSGFLFVALLTTTNQAPRNRQVWIFFLILRVSSCLRALVVFVSQRPGVFTDILLHVEVNRGAPDIVKGLVVVQAMLTPHFSIGSNSPQPLRIVIQDKMLDILPVSAIVAISQDW